MGRYICFLFLILFCGSLRVYYAVAQKPLGKSVSGKWYLQASTETQHFKDLRTKPLVFITTNEGRFVLQQELVYLRKGKTKSTSLTYSGENLLEDVHFCKSDSSCILVKLKSKKAQKEWIVLTRLPGFSQSEKEEVLRLFEGQRDASSNTTLVWIKEHEPCKNCLR